MNTETGFITNISEEIDKIPEERKTYLTKEEHEALMHFVERDRPKMLKDMRSKNHNAKRRARNKIAKQSRRRNRK